MKLKTPLLVIDVETTGLHPDRCFPISLGLVVVDKDLTKLIKFKWDIALPLTSQILTREFWAAKKVHGHSLRNMLFGHMDRTVVRRDLDYFASVFPGAPLAGHNAAFDAAFVKRLYEMDGLKTPFDYHVVDLSTLAQVHLGVKKLKEIAPALGIDMSRFTAHDALGDAELTADCFIELLKRLPEVSDGTVADTGT